MRIQLRASDNKLAKKLRCNIHARIIPSKINTYYGRIYVGYRVAVSDDDLFVCR